MIWNLIIRKPQSLPHTFAPVNPQGILLHTQVRSQIGPGTNSCDKYEFVTKQIHTFMPCFSPTELIFGATSATDGRVNFFVSCVNFLKNNAKCYKISSPNDLIVFKFQFGNCPNWGGGFTLARFFCNVFLLSKSLVYFSYMVTSRVDGGKSQ